LASPLLSVRHSRRIDARKCPLGKTEAANQVVEQFGQIARAIFIVERTESECWNQVDPPQPFLD